MNTNRVPDDTENLPPVASSRYARLQNCIQTQWNGLQNISLLKWSTANSRWEMWTDPDPSSGTPRSPDDSENLPPVAPSRFQRLDIAVSGQWAGIQTICVVKWQTSLWVMWKDPEP